MEINQSFPKFLISRWYFWAAIPLLTLQNMRTLIDLDFIGFVAQAFGILLVASIMPTILYFHGKHIRKVSVEKS